MATKNDQLNQEEREVLASFQRREWVSKEEDLDKYKAVVKKLLAKPTVQRCPVTTHK